MSACHVNSVTARLLIHWEQASIYTAILAIQVRQSKNTTIRVNCISHCSSQHIISIKWEEVRFSFFSTKACISKYIKTALKYQQTLSWGQLVISQPHNDKTLPFSFKAAEGFTSVLLLVSRKKHTTFITNQVRALGWHLKQKQFKQFDM